MTQLMIPGKQLQLNTYPSELMPGQGKPVSGVCGRGVKNYRAIRQAKLTPIALFEQVRAARIARPGRPDAAQIIQEAPFETTA